MAWFSLLLTFLRCELQSVPGVIFFDSFLFVNVSFVVIIIREPFFLITRSDESKFRNTTVEGKHVWVHIFTHDLAYATAEAVKNRSSFID